VRDSSIGFWAADRAAYDLERFIAVFPRQLAELASYLRIVGLLGAFEVLERQFQVVAWFIHGVFPLISA
jgi:hypothetical protein